MIINLKQLFNIVGEHKDIDCNIMPDELSGFYGVSFASSVHVKGMICNRAGVVGLSFSADFTLHIVCDRCLKELDRDYHYDFSHTVVMSSNGNNDEYIVAESESIDLNDIVSMDLILEMPSKFLCKEDCKGLCMMCGCDLNESECNCLK